MSESSFSPGVRPSTVTMSAPTALAASTMHEHTSSAVHQHRAGPALALLAGVLRAGKAEPLAQHVEQALSQPGLGDVVLRPLT